MTTDPAVIRPGQRWTFIHPGGKRARYVIGEVIPQGGGLDLIAQIINDDTGGIGWVTRHWLRRPEGNSYGHFVFDAEPVPA